MEKYLERIAFEMALFFISLTLFIQQMHGMFKGELKVYIYWIYVICFFIVIHVIGGKLFKSKKLND